jgi:hypothetical protein
MGEGFLDHQCGIAAADAVPPRAIGNEKGCRRTVRLFDQLQQRAAERALRRFRRLRTSHRRLVRRHGIA